MQSNSSIIANRQSPIANRQSRNYAQNSDEIIHVVLAVYDPSGTYSQHAGVVMTSIFENTKSKVTVHILHDDTLTEENRQKFIRTAEKYSQGLELHDVSEYTKRLGAEILRLSRQWTIGCMYRMFIPEILHNAEKVIYLDCDIVVNLNILELWNIDIGDNCLAGVRSGSGVRFSAELLRRRMMGIDECTYINSGVLIMNLKALRGTGNLLDISVKYFIKYKPLIRPVDQDILSGVFSDRIKIIDDKFNKRYRYNDEDMPDSIIHTPQIYRVWEISGKPQQKLYWKYYLRSAWGENKTPEEIIDTLVEASASPYYHPAKSQCFHRILYSLPQKIFTDNIVILTLKYIFLGACCRIKNVFSS